MKKFLNRDISFGLAIFICALILRSLIIVTTYVEPQSDGEYDNNIALNILAGNGFDLEDSSYSRPPLYPLLIAGIYKLFGNNNYLGLRLAQSVVSSFMCLLIYLIGLRLMGRSIGVIAGSIASIYPVFITSCSIYRIECLSSFLLTLVTWWIIKIREDLSYLRVCLLGILLGIMALVSGMMVLYIIFLLAAMAWTGYFRQWPLKKTIAFILILFLCFALPIAPWAIRNWKVYNAFVPISTQGGYMLYLSYKPPGGKLFGFNTIDETVLYAKALNSKIETSKYLTRATLRFIRQNPLKVAKLEALKFFFLWSPFDWEVLGINTKGVYNFMYSFIFPFFLIAFIRLKRGFEKFLPIYLPIIYLQVVTLLFYGSARFRIPMEPFLIIFASFGIYQGYQNFRNKYVFKVLLSIWLLGNVWFYFYSDQTKVFARSLFELVGLW